MRISVHWSNPHSSREISQLAQVTQMRQPAARNAGCKGSINISTMPVAYNRRPLVRTTIRNQGSGVSLAEYEFDDTGYRLG